MFDLFTGLDIAWCYYAIPSILIVLDIGTGLIKGWGNYSSVKMREGLKHKLSFILALALCTVIDVSQGFFDLGFSIPTLAAAAVYVSLTEILSCFENLCEMNSSLRDSKLAQLILGQAEKPAGQQETVTVTAAASETGGTNAPINTEETETETSAVTVKVADDTNKEAN